LSQGQLSLGFFLNFSISDSRKSLEKRRLREKRGADNRELKIVVEEDSTYQNVRKCSESPKERIPDQSSSGTLPFHCQSKRSFRFF